MLLLLSSMFTGYAAEPTWDMDTSEGSLSYSTTLQGTYTYDSLGDANIKNDESFSMTMKAICSTLQPDAKHANMTAAD